MDAYVKGLLKEAPEDMLGMAAMPAAEHLFEVSNVPEYLENDTLQLYHQLTAKLLFLCKWAYPELQMAVAFLTTWVNRPDVDDYKKLCHVIKYLQGTPDLALTLEADNAHVIKWWIDTSFMVHKDMHSHTGRTLSLRKGSLYSALSCQKINTESSTEAELVVAVDDVMPLILWMRYFLKVQG